MDRMRINAHEQAQELREYKVGFEANGVKFSYTPSICETCADLIDELESSNAELFAKAALFDAAVEKAEEYRKQIPQWIPCAEPIPKEIVIAADEYGCMIMGHIIETNNGFVCENDYEVLHDITHWMPKPKWIEE